MWGYILVMSVQSSLFSQASIKEVFYLSDKKQDDDVNMKASKKMIEHAEIRFRFEN